MAQSDFPFKLKNKGYFWFLLSVFQFSFSIFSFCQEEAESESQIITDFKEAPLYVSAGAQLGQYFGPEYGRRFPFRLTAEAGLWFQYSLFRQIPFYSGLEWQWRGYDIDNFKTEQNQNGNTFELKTKGQVNIHYLNFPFLLQIPAHNTETKLHFLAGLNTSFRFLYVDNYCADYQIPEIGFRFDSCYRKVRNDAMDYIDFHGVAGLNYQPHPRLMLMLLGAYKLGGISISKENFITRRELNTHFSLKILFQIGRIENLPFL